ncbi:MAG: septum site-determining protein MinC [Clostridia bacterium]|nr:septum site-determining protein MinC [Clostridia bacterium]
MNVKMGRDKMTLTLDETRSFAEQKEDVQNYLNKMSAFFARGNAIIEYEGAELTFFEETQLCEMLDEAFGRRIDFCYKKHPPEGLMRHITAHGERFLKSVKRTVRGGEEIKSNGDLLILGDVNPTAKLEAQGDIYVLGKLRGRAFAGCEGDCEAIVFALEMEPEQIQIANIAGFNDKMSGRGKICTARLNGDTIIIENF